MSTPLWPHQQQAVDKLTPAGRGALWMDMGDGKTRTALALAGAWGCRRILVLCPLKVCRVWPQEIVKHLDGEWLGAAFDIGTVRQRAGNIRLTALMASIDDVAFAASVNYDALVHQPLPQELVRIEWDLIVCDEAHRLKDPDGKQAQIVAQIAARIPHRLLLTGTPMPHSPLDVYAQWRVLSPETFGGDFFRFRQQYAAMEQQAVWYKPKPTKQNPKPKPAQRKVWAIRKDPETGQPVYRNLEQLQALLSPLVFRSAATAASLPPVTDSNAYCLLGPQTQRLYHDLETDFVAEFGDLADAVDDLVAGRVIAPNAMVKALRLAQIAGGFATDSKTGETIPVGTEKADLLAETISDLPKTEPVVVFARFVEDLASIKRVALAAGRGYREVSGRANELQQWQESAGNEVLGVQLQAGGVGVDLTRARYQIYFSLDFSLGNYQQTRKRIHRPGQTRPVSYIHLLAAGTVDEVILTALQRREATVAPVVEGVA